MAAVPQQSISAAEYLAFERGSTQRHEYFRGRIVALAGASEAHNLIVGNVFAALHSQLRRRPCRVYPSDMRVKVEQTGLYTYPDVLVVCGAPCFEDARRDTLLNPIVLVEVLSPSTESYDRWKKVQHYRTIESLAAYLLIAQDERQIERYLRQPGGQWLLSEFSASDAQIELDPIGCALALAEVYEKTDLALPDI